MNLFNALAISDINEILNEGRLRARLVEVNYIYKMEKTQNIWNTIFGRIHLPSLKNDLKQHHEIVEEDDLLSPFARKLK